MSSYALNESIVGDAYPALEGAWHGRIAVGATDMADRVMVVIPGYSETQQVGPCRWQSRDDTSHPARGDKCLVLFDDQQEPWVVAWWPFTP